MLDFVRTRIAILVAIHRIEKWSASALGFVAKLIQRAETLIQTVIRCGLNGDRYRIEFKGSRLLVVIGRAADSPKS